jgi:hypothetical protein
LSDISLFDPLALPKRKDSEDERRDEQDVSQPSFRKRTGERLTGGELLVLQRNNLLEAKDDDVGALLAREDVGEKRGVLGRARKVGRLGGVNVPRA